MPNNHTKDKTRKKPKKVVMKIISIIVIFVAIYMLIGVGKEVSTTLKLQRQAEEVEKQLKILEEENASLIQKRDKLEDPNYVETYARGEYMFSKDNEKIFYLPSSNESEE